MSDFVADFTVSDADDLTSLANIEVDKSKEAKRVEIVFILFTFRIAAIW
jgi:hypothetical protein